MTELICQWYLKLESAAAKHIRVGITGDLPNHLSVRNLSPNSFLAANKYIYGTEQNRAANTHTLTDLIWKDGA